MVSDLISPNVCWFASDRGSSTINVHAPNNQAWSASFQSSGEMWLSFTSSSSGKGPGELLFAVEPNTDAPRAGKIEVVAGQLTGTVNVMQLAAPRWYEEIVISAKLPIIEQTALLGFIKEINKAPPPARPLLLSALMEAIAGQGVEAEAIYLAYSQVPQTFTQRFIQHEVHEAITFVKKHLSGQ